jgi:hypothetical protein
MGWAASWAISSHTHPVTLIGKISKLETDLHLDQDSVGSRARTILSLVLKTKLSSGTCKARPKLARLRKT